MKNSFFSLAIFVTALCFLPIQALAKDTKDKTQTKPPQKYECKLISRADAISQARRRINGKVVGVQLSDRGNRSVYRVRMLVDKKRVKTLSIRACR